MPVLIALPYELPSSRWRSIILLKFKTVHRVRRVNSGLVATARGLVGEARLTELIELRVWVSYEERFKRLLIQNSHKRRIGSAEWPLPNCGAFRCVFDVPFDLHSMCIR